MFGLYTGSSGVAFAAVCVGRLLAEDSIVESARRLVQRIASASSASSGFDLLSGRAGAVSALLVLYETLHDQGLLDFALRLGDDLLRSAERMRRGWSWSAEGELKHRNLTGLSHGAAGAGHALLELFDITGEPLYRAGAEGAFQYERSWFSHTVGNWPDFREAPRRRTKQGQPATYRTQWCHGAAGIALTRLRAYDLLGDPRYREEALTALATTARDSAAALARGSLSYCLCHGLGGQLAREIGTAGMAAYGQGRRPWPCGIPVPGRETPGLMLGLAGIGHVYLRLERPAVVPSVLFLRRRNFCEGLAALAALRAQRER